MELDFELMTLLLTAGFYIFILLLVWKIPFGFSRLREKIIITILALPLTYLMIVWQKNK